MSRLRCLRDITKESFFLIHGCPLDFLLSKWCDNPLVYTVWSTLCSVYTVALVIYTSFASGYGIKILIWLTYWAFYSVTLRFIITAWNCWQFVLNDKTLYSAMIPCHLPGRANNTNGNHLGNDSELVMPNCGMAETNISCEERQISDNKDDKVETHVTVCSDEHGQDQPDGLSAMLRCQWFLQNISNSASILVTVLFWALVYTGDTQNYASINSHVINSLLVIGDIMISRAPIRIQHLHIPFIYLAIYITFTLIYWAAGGTNHKGEYFIYGVLDYSKRVKTAVVAICLIALLGLLITQMFLYFLHRLRNCLYSWGKTGKFIF
ncbi:unnamed protein product [Candidula unifasciata]|uniref:Uncharacterized protein n=1 Tax=Candidula unifasciata TaxID=100452 RepID=A0A8S3ZW48_9EUPU|nr:unnamed protein product [Candidula unifasciata]